MSEPNETRPFSRRGIERRFAAAVADGDLLHDADCVVAGLSGGPDSTALVLLLDDLSARIGFHLEVAHFDHQIRPADERARERETVRDLTSALKLRLYEGGADIPRRAQQARRSLEEQARIERYRFLGSVAADAGASAVAVGHTASDQAETLLLHLLRGTGVRGLAGMPAESPWVFGTGPRLIRPLLSLTRPETEAYCRLRGFAPHTDSSNADRIYRRNRIRSELLPLLREFNPAVEAALLRLAGAAAEQQGWLDELVDQAFSSEVSVSGAWASLSLASLRGLPRAVQSELLARCYAAVVGDRRGLSERHRRALRRLSEGDAERALDLPLAVQASLRAGVLSFERAEHRRGEAPAPALLETALTLPGRTSVGLWEVIAELLAPGAAVPTGDAYAAVLEADQLELPLVVRSRRPGDRMRLAGMEGTKKVQDILTDAKVPRSARDMTPILCSGREILWVAGHRRSAPAPPVDAAHRLLIRIRRAG